MKELRSILRVANYLRRTVPVLANFCALFGSIKKGEAEWKWTHGHEKAFSKDNGEVKRIRELTHFKRNHKVRLTCDASKKG